MVGCICKWRSDSFQKLHKAPITKSIIATTVQSHRLVSTSANTRQRLFEFDLPECVWLREPCASNVRNVARAISWEETTAVPQKCPVHLVSPLTQLVTRGGLSRGGSRVGPA